MNINDIQILHEYNRWANAKILTAAAGLPPDQFITPARANWGSLRGTLAHVLGAQLIWLTRIKEGQSPNKMLAESEFPDVESLAKRWVVEDQRWIEYLASLRDEDLNRTIVYHSTRGEPRQDMLWTILVHLVNHGTNHRAEAGLLLTDLGRSPGDIDMTVFFRQKK